ncbi:hypothetical protein B0H19DRAFT_1298478 [Mycena capillaripes]|nr:hypothetical protein B0H19DRAFT_1298478 [Mycena capillaripes]
MRFIRASATVFLLGVSTVAGANAGGILVPLRARSPTSIGSRAWKRELAPKDIVNLDYGMDMAAFPSTTLKFTAHSDTPIVLLEEIEYLVDTIACYDSGLTSATEVELNFRWEDACKEALASWSSYASFILVTSHLTCNLDDRRGAWLVTHVQGQKMYPQIKLTAQPMPLREIGASFRISYSAVASSSWLQSQLLDKRLDFDPVFNFGHTIDFAPRQQLFPPDPSLLQRPVDQVLDVSETGGVQIFCVDCVSRANFSLGAQLDVSDLGTKINSAHINVTVQQFQHDIQFEVSLDGTVSLQKSLDIIRVPLPYLGIKIPEIGEVGFFYGGAITANLDITGGLNFTIGAKTSVPPGATATFVMAGNGSSSTTGWDASSFDLIPFRLNSGSPNASTQLSLSPFLEAEITLFDKTVAQGRLSVNTPHLTASAQIQANVNRECQPVGANDFEFFETALTFGAGASLEIAVSSNGSLVPDEDDTIFTHPVNFGSFPSPEAPACFIITDDNAGDTGPLAGQSPSPTGTLLTVAAAVPTFDIPKIESFYSANGALPTNVNATQLAQVTGLPADLKGAVNKEINAAGILRIPHGILFLIGAAVTIVVFL